MPKNREQKTTVKEKSKVTTVRRKLVNLHSESVAEKAAGKATAPEIAVTSSEMEQPASAEKSEITTEDFADVSEESASIISIVKGLEEQVDTAFKLKEILETDLDAALKKLSEELAARSQLEAQVDSLKAQADAIGQLREDLSFIEEERNKFAGQLTKIKAQLGAVTEERDLLAQKATSTEARTTELEGEKTTLEAQVMNLKDKVTEIDHLRRQLAETVENHRALEVQIAALSGRLEASEKSKNAIKADLTGANETIRSLREKLEDLREKLKAADSRTAELRTELEDYHSTNKELIEAKTRLENETKMTNIKYDAARNELDATKKALRDIRSEATLTSGRIRQRYLKASEKNGPSGKKN